MICGNRYGYLYNSVEIPVVQKLSSAVAFTAITTELQEMGKRTFDTWIYRTYLLSIYK
jgi:hypothetical protein